MDIRRIEQSFQTDQAGKCSRASGGMVASAFPEATHAGVEMLQLGGNAVDAACAAALALCVCEPQACGVGGQSMAMVGVNGKYVFLNGSGRVPLKLRPDKLDPYDLHHGYRATSVPTTLAVIEYMNRHFGVMKWEELFKPAIDIARNGYRITRLQHDLQERELTLFHQHSSAVGGAYFLKNGTAPYAPGDLFKQSDLALVLEQVAKNGADEFYTGDIAHAIAEDMDRNQGFLSLEDLQDIPWPSPADPLAMNLKGVTLHVPPPPSPGRGLLMMLQILEQIYNGDRDAKICKEQITAEIIRTVLTSLAGRPVFARGYIPEQDPMLDHGSHDLIAKHILNGNGLASRTRVTSPVGGETTHLSVMDKDGNSVGITQSINLVYGAKAAANGLGFLYNNYLVDCNQTDPCHPHFLKPGGMPVSMVCPTIVSLSNRPWMVTGSPGSDRILSAVFQFLSHIFHDSRSMDIAMTEPRLHCQPCGHLILEESRFDAGVIRILETAGYDIEWSEPWSFFHGAVHAAMMCHETKGFQGVAEIRRDGIAAGPGGVL